MCEGMDGITRSLSGIVDCLILSDTQKVQAFDGDMRISLEDSPGKKVSKIPTQRTS
jgi:hypothetical protein